MQFYKTPSYQSFISKQGLLLTLLAFLISLASSFLAYTKQAEGLDWLLYDNAMQLSQLPPADDVVIIDIDDKSIAQLGRWPWSRRTHADLLGKLSDANTQAVVFDVLFPELDTSDYASDLRFAQAIKQNGNVILPIYIEMLGQQGQVIESPPHGLFYAEVKALGHVHLHAESDGIFRSVFLKEGVGKPYWPHLSLALYHALGAKDLVMPGSRADGQEDSALTVSIARDFHNLIPMPSAEQGLRHYSYSDVLSGKVALEHLSQKIIFIGATAAGLGDVLATPVGSMNGVELNAWIFQGLRHHQMIQTLPAFSLSIITFFSVLVCVLLLGRLSPRLLLLFSLVSVVGLITASIFCLLWKNIWLPPIASIIGIVAFFPLWSWLRAESILRFLRAEIEALSHSTIHEKDASKRQDNAQYFLEQMGMFDAKTQQATPKGERAIQALCAEHEGSLYPDFWHKQIDKYSSIIMSSPKANKGVEVVARTISQLTTIKENDKKNRQLIEKSLSSLQDAVCITDLCGDITFTNHRFKEWFQHDQKADVLLNVLSNIRLKSSQTWSQVLSGVYQTNKLFTGEATLKVPHDQQFLCQASLVSINEEYNDTLILTFTDITQLKVAENARTEALSFLSHDLRSPMVSVLAILERYHSDARPQLSDESIQHIESLVRKNLDYAESFLQLSKADALHEMTMSPCDLHAVLDSAHVQAISLAASKSISVVTERCDDDVWVLGDINLLERALINLISNAIKFSPTGSTLYLSLNKQGQEALLSVKDQGVGIDKADQATIFDRFTRIKSTQAIEGAGLGLNFVETVARKHKGRVELNSELNHGSTFTLHLPALNEQEIFEFDD